MNNTNRLVTPDNKGLAEYLFEKDFKEAGNDNFVGAFCSANLGDVSPNTGGPFCLEGPQKDQPCDYATSTCLNDRGIPRTQYCHNKGPAGHNDRENSKIIGTNQYNKAKELYASARQQITGRLQYRQMYVDMPSLYVNVSGQEVKMCRAAMGFSFAAGTCDGPGFLNFFQGDTNPDHPFWDTIVGFIKPPTEELLACQAPKPVLLPTGEAFRPHAWHPSIVDVQMFVIGDLVILIVPGEFSTMAGRRFRDAIRKVLTDGGVISADAIVVMSGLSSTYTHYITTFEEYQVQRYEAASTIFGPNSLSAYIQLFTDLAEAIVNNATVPAGPTPPNLYDDLIKDRSPKLYPDVQQDFNRFGAVKTDVQASYAKGGVVTVLFYGANPRNDLMTGKTFLEVQQLVGGTWTVVRTDNDFDTEFRWVPLHAEDAVEFISDILITWITDASVASGSYRIAYYGNSRDAQGVVTPHTGLSSTFTIQ